MSGITAAESDIHSSMSAPHLGQQEYHAGPGEGPHLGRSLLPHKLHQRSDNHSVLSWKDPARAHIAADQQTDIKPRPNLSAFAALFWPSANELTQGQNRAPVSNGNQCGILPKPGRKTRLCAEHYKCRVQSADPVLYCACSSSGEACKLCSILEDIRDTRHHAHTLNSAS